MFAYKYLLQETLHAYKNILNCKGRMRRSSFFCFCLSLTLIGLITLYAFSALSSLFGIGPGLVRVVGIVWFVVVTIVFYIAQMRRLHDFGVSGWYALALNFGPNVMNMIAASTDGYIALIFMVLAAISSLYAIFFLLSPSDEEANAYGPSPIDEMDKALAAKGMLRPA